MSAKKKIIFLLILVLLVYLWYFFFYTKSNPRNVKLTSTKENLSLFIEPDSGKSFLINEIDNAKKEILVEVYLLSDSDIINSLEKAKDKGVDVRVMLEEHPFGGGGLNPKAKEELSSHGISVQWSNSSFALTHEKAVVIDNNLAFILNQNLTTSAFSKNREYNILDRNQKDIDEIRNIFNADWSRFSFVPSLTNIIESPNTARTALTSFLRTAKKEIDIEVEVIEDKEIISILKSQSQLVKINLIIPTLAQISSNKKAIDELSKSKVQIKTLSSPYLHAKMVLIDNRYSYVGSINFSSQSLDLNRELGIILSQKDIIENLSASFSKDWEKANVLPSNP